MYTAILVVGALVLGVVIGPIARKTVASWATDIKADYEKIVTDLQGKLSAVTAERDKLAIEAAAVDVKVEAAVAAAKLTAQTDLAALQAKVGALTVSLQTVTAMKAEAAPVAPVITT